jgi:protein-L-isoaspartate O-methyltransferase
LGWYSNVVFPRFCDLFLGRGVVAKRRQELLASAYGNVLEIGFGTGLNLPYYPENVGKITTVEPSMGMHRLAQRRVKQAGIDVDQRILSGQRLPSIASSARLRCAASTGWSKP